MRNRNSFSLTFKVSGPAGISMGDSAISVGRSLQVEAKEFDHHFFGSTSHWRVRDAKVYKGNQEIRVQDDLQLGKKDYRPESQL